MIIVMSCVPSRRASCRLCYTIAVFQKGRHMRRQADKIVTRSCVPSRRASRRSCSQCWPGCRTWTTGWCCQSAPAWRGWAPWRSPGTSVRPPPDAGHIQAACQKGHQTSCDIRSTCIPHLVQGKHTARHFCKSSEYTPLLSWANCGQQTRVLAYQTTRIAYACAEACTQPRASLVWSFAPQTGAPDR